MKTIEELTNLGALAAYSGRGQQEYDISINPASSFWEKDKPAREAFAAAVRDAVLADQPAADVATWRPIAEFPARSHDLSEYVYWDGDMAWHGDFTEKQDATHFLAPPPKRIPFEVWWATQNRTGKHKAECREAWNAAVASTSEKEFYGEAENLVGRPINLP